MIKRHFNHAVIIFELNDRTSNSFTNTFHIHLVAPAAGKVCRMSAVRRHNGIRCEH